MCSSDLFSRNSDIEFIQLKPSLIWWIRGIPWCAEVCVYKSSTSTTRGKSCAEDVARVANESACVFPLLGTWDKSKTLNYSCMLLIWHKYSCILESRASRSPLTCPTTNFESEKTLTAFPPIFWTIIIPISKALHYASLFVAEKFNLKAFSMVILSGDTRTSPTPDPRWLATLSTRSEERRVGKECA